MPKRTREQGDKIKRRARKHGDLNAVRTSVFNALARAENTLHESSTPSDIARLVHAISTAAGVFAKLYESDVIESKLMELEERLHAEQQITFSATASQLSETNFAQITSPF